MRFLLDEMFSPRTVVALTAAGLEASHVRDHGLAATDDDLVLEFACEQGWILLTANLRDFRPLHAERVARGASVTPLLLVTQATLNGLGSRQPQALVELVRAWVRGNPNPYAGEHWLGPHVA